MKFLSVTLLFLISALHLHCSTIPINNFLPKDSLTNMEWRIIKQLDALYAKIREETLKTNSLQQEFSTSTKDKKRQKTIKRNIDKLQESLSFNYQKQNAYNYLLTQSRLIRIQDELTAKSNLEFISKALLKLEKNKLPEIPGFKDVPAKAYLSNPTDVYALPVYTNCNITRSPDGKIIANEYEILYEYTDPKMGDHFKDKEFMECNTRFIKTKKDYFLELKIDFASTKAKNFYGNIDPSNPAKFSFINGDHIFLEAHAVAGVQTDEANSTTSYTVQYKLDKEDLKNLSNKDISILTIIWQNGAEHYDIANIDILRNMYACIQKRKLQN